MPATSRQVAVSIVIVNYKTRDFLEGCLQSLRAAPTAAGHEVIVVDNGSADGSREMVRRRFPEVCLIENATNRGFGAANNLGVGRARAEFVLLLNSDTEVEPGAIDSMVEFLIENDSVGIAGCRLRVPGGRVQRSVRSFPGLGTSMRMRRRTAPEDLPGYYDHRHMDVDYVSGAFMIMRRRTFGDLGGFDERFFMYAEDADLCWRARAAGHRVAYNPSAAVLHYGGGSSNCDARREAMRVAGRLRFVRMHRSAVHFRLFILLSMLAVIGKVIRGHRRWPHAKKLLAEHWRSSARREG